jgi:hypothetical protein
MRKRREVHGGSGAPGALLRWTLLLGVLLVGACEEKPLCYEGDQQACTCDDGQCGFAACDVGANAYGACGSCGQVPAPADSDVSCEDLGTGGGGGEGGAPALLAFMETCSNDEECETGLCHTFNAKGPKCSMPCQSDGDCPDPSPGCNNMGVCKAP